MVNILIAEDDQNLQLLLKDRLKPYYNILCANDGPLKDIYHKFNRMSDEHASIDPLRKGREESPFRSAIPESA